MNIFILLLFLSSLVYSKTPEEIARLAVERTPQLIIGQQELQARSLGVNQSRLWKNPTVSMQTGKARTGRDHAHVMDLTFMQPLPWPGTKEILSGEARLLEDLAKLDVSQAELRIYHATLLMSIEFGYMEKLNESNQKRRQRLNGIKKYLNAKSIISENDKIEASMINNQMLLVDNYIFEIRSKMSNLKSKIKRLAGVEVDTVSLELDQLSLAPKEEFMTFMTEGPEWKKQHKQIEIAKNQVKKTELESRPEVQVGLNYRVEHLRPENEFIHANVGVTVPLWDRGQYRQEIARAQLKKQEASQKLTEMNLLNSFDEIYQQMQLSFHQTQNFSMRKLQVMEKEINEAEVAFKKGRITAISLLGHDNLVNETMNLTYKARYEYYRNLADLNELIGKKTDLK
jgi:outer membrane protein TolC